jgi:hypothetical protein
VSKQYWHSARSINNPIWLYLLAGYVVGFVAAHMLSQHDTVGEKAEAFLGGLGVALSGRALGSPWRP